MDNNNDLISRSRVKNEYLALMKELTKSTLEPLSDNAIGALAGYLIIEDAPAVDAAPVVHARWQGVSPFVDTEECSNCKYNIQSEELEMPYCPWCGAKMDGDN